MHGGPRLLGAALAAFTLGTAVTVLSIDHGSTGVAARPQTRPNAAATPAQAEAKVAAGRAYGRLPLAFEANGGRIDKRVDFIARGKGYTLFLTPAQTVLTLGHGRGSGVVRTSLTGAAHVRGQAQQELPGKVNSFVGPRSAWRTGISTYRQVRYPGVYPGIDLVYYGHSGRLEYDFQVAPGADPSRIGLDVAGARGLRLDGRGNLALATRGGTLHELRPVAFQTLPNGARRTVGAGFVVHGHHVRLAVGHYDRSLPLTIDPVLGYSTYLGGSSSDDARGIAVDGNNNAYVTGSTASSTFPLKSAFRSAIGGTDAFVTELNASGTDVVYSTYFGGSGTDIANAIGLDSSANAYIGGSTTSSDMPNSQRCGPIVIGQTCPGFGGGQDGFAAKINANGTLGWAMYVGGTGTDTVKGIAVDGNGDADVVGQTSSSNLPTLNPVQGAFGGGSTDAFVARLHYYTCTHFPCIAGTVGLDYAYSSYLGGTGDDDLRAVAVDPSNLVYAAGATTSTLDSGAAAWPPSGGSGTRSGTDALVAKFDTSQSGAASLGFAKYFAGTSGGSTTNFDEANGIALAVVYSVFVIGPPSVTAHIVGDTTSSSLPSVSSVPPLTYGSQSDGFVAQFDSAGTFSTSPGPAFIGGNGNDSANAIAVTARTFFSHNCGGFGFGQNTTVAEYIVGDETSSDFLNGQTATKLGNSADESLTNKQAFLLKRAFPACGNPTVAWVAQIGGSSTDSGRAVAVDGAARTYMAGQAAFQLPTTDGAFQPGYGGSNDGFVARIDLQPPIITQGPADGSILKSGDVTFNWNATDSPAFYCSGDTAGVLNNTSRIGCDPPKEYPDLADGPHTFGVSTIDAGGTQSDQATRSFIVDTQPPQSFDLIAPDDNATVQTTKPAFSWHQASDAATQVSYQILVDGQPVGSAGSDACGADGACSAAATTPIITGSHKWKIRATDQADHSTDSAERTIVVQDPPVAKFTIAPNPSLAGRSVAFDATGSNDATHTIAHYEWDLDGNGTFESDAGSTPTITKAYSTPATIKVSLRVTDASGLSGASTQTLVINGAGGVGGLLGVTINNGAQYTRTPNVTVSAVFPKGTTQMLFSNDGGFLNPGSFPPQKDTPWKLDSSGPERLPKTIYVRFFTGPIASETFQDDIILDEIPPVVQSATLDSGAGSAASVASIARLRTWKVKVRAKDSNSGVKGVQVTASKKKPGKLIKYKTKVSVKSATRPRWIRARDKAGNNSRWRKLK